MPDTARPRRVLTFSRIFVTLAVVMTVTVTATGVVGYQLFVRDHSDPLRKADAIVVLGGEHDGREDYGLQLAREGYASTVVVSDPYINEWYNSVGKELMSRVCNSSTAQIEVICFQPDPSTTRGEAMYVEKLAEKRGWSSVIVISWRYHLVRARYIFGQCFSGQVVMRGVPRSYDIGVFGWVHQFAYQYGGLAKAASLGC